MTTVLPTPAPDRRFRRARTGSTSAPPSRCPVANAGTASNSGRTTRVPSASVRWRSPTSSRSPARLCAQQIEAGPDNIWRWAPLLPVPAGVAADPEHEPRQHQADPRRQPGPRARHENPVGQGRFRAIRRTRSRTGWSPSRWPPPANWASRCSPARPPATWPTPSPPPPPGPASARWCWSRATSSSRRSSPPPPTAAPWSPSRATTTTSTGSPGRSPPSRRTGRSSTSTSGPYYAEGSKTLGFEVAEQLGWRLPEQLVIPIASGAQLVKIDKGFTELGELGPGRADAVQGVRRAGDRLLPGVGGVQGRRGHGAPGAAGHHRQVARDRQPRRRPVRAGRHPPDRRRRRGRQRRRGHRRASSCWPAPRASSPRPRAG